ncbi:hypothetical protein KSP39_PZI012600 [Platanthera zijinensis]|uniref:Uncharacterized protein n=1 Tax=Platanthera zijinensis TaxID=2320716 RepID=A0AAP0G510_9ASPA
MLMWIAAEAVYPSQRFQEYAILGDDVVIADQAVADVDRKILESCDTGALEFAKRFVTDRGQCDLSPVSQKVIGLLASSLGSQYHKMLGIQSMRISYRLRGASYRVYSVEGRRLDIGCFNISLQAYLLIPWNSGFDSGCIDCYELGYIRASILEAVKPKHFHESEFDRLRVDDEDNWFERFIQEWPTPT